MIHFPDVFKALLASRGLSGEEQEVFLNPDYNKLHDPLLLPDMEKARDRVIQAMRDGERITIFSDYDADGIPGAAVLSDFFRRAEYENVSFYIPHRHDEGFGLNLSAVREIAREGAKLIITVDCGIADIEEIKLANELGLEVIVTDHHQPSPSGLPSAYAVIDPKRKDSEYPFSELCGAALAYKLVQAIILKESFGIKEGMEKWSLDLVAIATLSDMVPLVGENRILARYGLDVLKKTLRPGLTALLRHQRIEQKTLTEDDVVFMITPRINAASRMGVPQDAFHLLSTESRAEAERLVEHLDKINNERKGVVASLVKGAKKHLAQREKIGRVIVIGNPEWRPSLLGLVANSLVEEYERPAFVWGRDGDGTLKGSCRSYDGYNLHDLMQKASSSFTQFGGHAGAGGFTVTLEQLTNLEDDLSQALEQCPTSDVGQAESSLTVQLGEVGEKLWETVLLFAPFGMGNPKPVFKIKSEVKGIKTFGKEKNHLEVVVTDGENDVKCISFFSSPATYNLSIPGIDITVLAHLEKSYFMNRPELRLRIVDIIK